MVSRSLPLFCLAMLLQAAGCAGEDESGEEGVVRHRVGDVVGDFLLEGAGDLRVRLSELRSRVVLIHFFQTDSDECRAGVQQIRSLWFPHRAAGMNVLGVCPETRWEDVHRAMRDWGLPYPVFLDPDRALTRRFAPREYPWNVVVGRDGTVLFTERGGWDRVRLAVEEAIQGKVEGPAHVRVQHLLIAFGRSAPGKTIERSKKEAASLAADVFERAKAGGDFDELVKEHTEDRWPGIHAIANYNVESEDDANESERGNVVQSFGDVAFSLEVGEIGMAEYHPVKSPHGWHVIKRLE